MHRGEYLFTSESVAEGHPDKLCDRISDSVVDLYLGSDSNARCAVETLTTTNHIVLAGEVRGGTGIDHEVIEKRVREVVRDVGYDDESFHWKDAKLDILLHEQSPDIAQGVDATSEVGEGAGDQGVMFGYACKETDALMPAPIFYAHKILRTIAEARKSGLVKGLGPDAKSQITVRYENHRPVGIKSALVSSQHDESLNQDDVREILFPLVQEALPQGWLDKDTPLLINPTGKFVIGGPHGDAGLTGRKIIVDTYGGAALHGGGAFSGKDPTKVDRSAAYAARHLAKNAVAAGLAARCTIQLSYAIGVAEPLSIYVNFHSTGKVEESALESLLREQVKLTPRGIRERLQLARPIYERTACYGHFGREADADGGFSWELLDLVDLLKDALLPTGQAEKVETAA